MQVREQNDISCNRFIKSIRDITITFGVRFGIAMTTTFEWISIVNKPVQFSLSRVYEYSHNFPLCFRAKVIFYTGQLILSTSYSSSFTLVYCSAPWDIRCRSVDEFLMFQDLIWTFPAIRGLKENHLWTKMCLIGDMWEGWCAVKRPWDEIWRLGEDIFLH